VEQYTTTEQGRLHTTLTFRKENKSQLFVSHLADRNLLPSKLPVPAVRHYNVNNFCKVPRNFLTINMSVIVDACCASLSRTEKFAEMRNLFSTDSHCQAVRSGSFNTWHGCGRSDWPLLTIGRLTTVKNMCGLRTEYLWRLESVARCIANACVYEKDADADRWKVVCCGTMKSAQQHFVIAVETKTLKEDYDVVLRELRTCGGPNFRKCTHLCSRPDRDIFRMDGASHGSIVVRRPPANTTEIPRHIYQWHSVLRVEGDSQCVPLRLKRGR